jgi:predicted Zn finger-like uncharacterized protein
MRIICPSCAAEYEVEDPAIPPEGRDVQCSNCGRAWFQLPNTPMSGAPAPKPATPVSEAVAEPVAEPVARAGAETETAQEAPGPETAAPAAHRLVAAPAPPRAGRAGEDDEDEAAFPARRATLDEALREMLRAEAEREAAARRAEAAALETQPELGLPRPAAPRQENAPPARPAPAAGASRQSAEVASAEVVPGRSTPRKRLPEIDEVDPVIAPKLGLPAEPAPPAAAVAQRGFRTGFLMVLAVALVLLLVYLYGRMQADAGPVLSSYVALVDDTRLLLSTRLEALVRRMTEMMASGA